MDSPWAVRILCSHDEDYCLAVRGDKVVATFVDHRDKFQYWIKDEKQSTKGEEGRGSSTFSLVNYATGLAIQNCALEKDLPLVDYTHKADPSDKTNVAAVWTISDDTDHKGFYCICRADDMSLLIVVRIGHGLHDGNPACLETQNSPDGTFRWKLVPFRDTTLQRRSPTQRKTVKIYCREKESHYMTIHNDTIMLAPSNPKDKYQHWIKETAYCEHVKDETNNKKAFALVNKATGKAMGHYLGPHNLVQLVPFNQRYLDPTILWTEGTSNFEGFREIRMLTNISVGLDAFIGGQQSSLLLVGVWNLTRTAGRGNQLWMIEEFN